MVNLDVQLFFLSHFYWNDWNAWVRSLVVRPFHVWWKSLRAPWTKKEQEWLRMTWVELQQGPNSSNQWPNNPTKFDPQTEINWKKPLVDWGMLQTDLTLTWHWSNPELSTPKLSNLVVDVVHSSAIISNLHSCCQTSKGRTVEIWNALTIHSCAPSSCLFAYLECSILNGWHPFSLWYSVKIVWHTIHHSIQVIIGHCGPHFETITTDFCSAQVFACRAHTRFGESIRVVGDCDAPLWHALIWHAHEFE